MKLQSLLLSSFLASAFAAPAIVWKSSRTAEEKFVHTSDEMHASELLKDVLNVEPSDSALAAVVFLVAKGDDGSESLTELAASGKLPVTAEKYSDADGIYHHVSGIESTHSMAQEASRANTEHTVLEVSMSELNRKLTSLSEEKVEMEVSNSGAQVQSTRTKHANKRAKQLGGANVLMVKVDPKSDASEIDQTITNTIDNKKIENVVLAGVRSLNEVKHEREMASMHRMKIMQKEGDKVLASRRRRLEQEEQEGDEGGDDQGADMSGVYYVHMTPNILAGLLFLALFTVVTWIGITCLGAISGQDVFVSKMPSVGREA